MERLGGYEAKGAKFLDLTKEHDAERYNLPDHAVVDYLNAKTKHDYGGYITIRT